MSRGRGSGRTAAGRPEALAELLRDAGKTPPLSLAAGPSEYWRERVVAAFRDGASASGAEFVRLEGDELDEESLAGALASLSLFASSRRLWIREGAKVAKACEDRLLNWAAAPAAGLAILVTTARETSDLKFLTSLAERAAVAACVERPADARRDGSRVIEEAGLRLPAGAAEALLARTGSLLALRRECEKLSLAADAAGTLPARAFDAVAAGRTAASAERWAAAAVRGDRAAARAEAAALDAAGVSGGNALWAAATIGLAGLEPQAFAYRRGSAIPAIAPARARTVLDAVYRADRAMKRGEIRDAEICDLVEHVLMGGTVGRNA